MSNSTKLPVPHRIAVVKATRAENDEQLLQSWLKSLSSPHTQRNFETTARRVLAELPMGLREATVEDVRTALENVTQTVGKATRQQYILRTKSPLGYAHKLGFAPFPIPATVALRSPSASSARLKLGCWSERRDPGERASARAMGRAWHSRARFRASPPSSRRRRVWRGPTSYSVRTVDGE